MKVTLTLAQLKRVFKLEQTSFSRLITLLDAGGVVACGKSEIGLYDGLDGLIRQKGGKVWVKFDINGMPVAPMLSAVRSLPGGPSAVAGLWKRTVEKSQMTFVSFTTTDWGIFKKLAAELDKDEMEQVFKLYTSAVPQDLRSPLHFFKNRKKYLRAMHYTNQTKLLSKSRKNVTPEEWAAECNRAGGAE